MKKTILAIMLLCLLCSCGTGGTGESQSHAAGGESALVFTDAMGYEVNLNSWERVVCLYGSFGETWMLAGGQLAGTTSDAVEERGLTLGEDVAVVGTVKQPNLEEILAVDPDFVVLSADIAAQVDLHEALVQAGIVHAYYRVDTFQEYLDMLEQFCTMTGRKDLYEENGLSVEAQIQQVLKAVEGKPSPSVLLLRAFSTGVKAKGDDNLAGVILRDLGADNLVSRYESMLEDVSIEEIIAADPDYIFVVTMGSSEEKAMDYMAEHLESNPAWAELTAVKNDRYILLSKELFHYKPNVRWGESYEVLAELLYPELAGQIG